MQIDPSKTESEKSRRRRRLSERVDESKLTNDTVSFRVIDAKNRSSVSSVENSRWNEGYSRGFPEDLLECCGRRRPPLRVRLPYLDSYSSSTCKTNDSMPKKWSRVNGGKIEMDLGRVSISVEEKSGSRSRVSS